MYSVNMVFVLKSDKVSSETLIEFGKLRNDWDLLQNYAGIDIV